MSNVSTRQLGSICRIYKNNAGKVIAIDDVSVTVNKDQIRFDKILVHVDTIRTNRTLLHLTTGASRVVATIQTIGNYSSIEENSGDFLIPKWNAASANENDVEISLASYVAKIGDSV
jgi:hypothetical protein